MKLIRIISIVINSLGSTAALLSGILMGILASLFISSHVSSDQTVGFIIAALVIEVICLPLLFLSLVINHKRGGKFWTGLSGGLLFAALQTSLIMIVPKMIGYAAMP